MFSWKSKTTVTTVINEEEDIKKAPSKKEKSLEELISELVELDFEIWFFCKTRLNLKSIGCNIVYGTLRGDYAYADTMEEAFKLAWENLFGKNRVTEALSLVEEYFNGEQSS